MSIVTPRGTVAHLKAKLLQCEEELAAQQVCRLTPSIVSCTVAAGRLGGAMVKVKCRGGKATLMKSEVCLAPGEGGPLSLVEPTGKMIYEGDEELRFELCRARWWRSSEVLAAGSLPLAEVLATAGLDGEERPWTVPLLCKGEDLGCVEVSIRCRMSCLGNCGGAAALKVFTLTPRPEVSDLTVGGELGDLVASQVESYCASSRKAKADLQAVLATATALAKNRTVNSTRSFGKHVHFAAA